MPAPDEVTLILTELPDGSEEVTLNVEEPAGPPGPKGDPGAAGADSVVPGPKGDPGAPGADAAIIDDSIVTAHLMDQAVTAAKIADGVLASACVRPAAYGGADASAMGSFGDVAWGARNVDGFDFEYECTVFSTVAPSSDCLIMGSLTSGRGVMTITPDGSLHIGGSGTPINPPNPGTVLFDGTEQTLKVHFADDVVETYVNGELVSSTSHATSWSSAANARGIGGRNATSQRWPGGLRDVIFRDNRLESNTAIFPMDEIKGDFINIHPNSTAGNATRNGLVLATNVLGEEGSVPVLSKECYLHFGNGGSKTLVTGTNKLQIMQTGLNETGSLAVNSDDIYTAVAPGRVEMTANWTQRANAQASDLVDIIIDAGGSVYAGSMDVGSVASDLPCSFPSAFPIAAGESIQVWLQNVAASSTTAQIANFSVTIKFYPDPQ